MSIFFISDLHLSPHRPKLIELAIDFLQNHIRDMTTLYILGDLFDVWIGDDIIASEFSPFIRQLRHLQQCGVTTYLMVGNRDFMLGKDFAHYCRCLILSDPSVINLYGQQVLITHGDSLCTNDIEYQRYRYWSRNNFLRKCFLYLPMQYRQNILAKIKQKNCEQKQHKSTMTMDVNYFEVDKVLRRHGVRYLIHGHTHCPAMHDVTIDTAPAYRIVLGDWDDEISYLKCESHKCTLIAPLWGGVMHKF